MGNPYKIKRHNRIYRKSAKGVIMRVLVVGIAVAFLFGVGWLLYSPVTQFINDQRSRKAPDSTMGQSEEGEQTPPLEQTEPPAETAPAADKVTEEIRATAFLPEATVADRAAFGAALEALKGQGYDSVMVGLKLIDGTVTYPISYKPDLDSRYTAANAVDLKETADLITAAGFKPVASVYAFRDHLYPLADKTAATKYSGSEMLWVDNDPQQGGKPWMNPFSESAQAYLQKIIDDAIAAGFEKIVLQAVQFPEGYSLNLIEYGENAGADKQQFLKQYLAGLTEYGKGKGASLSAVLPAGSMLGGDSAPYFGDTALLAGEAVVVDMRPSSFGAGLETDQVSIPTPAADPYNTVKTAAAAIKAKLPNAEITGMIQGTGMTRDQVADQVKGLAESGITSYVVEYPPVA